MKRLLFLFLATPILGFGQFVDDFSDGDFLANPTWQGGISKFQVNANFQLQSSAPAGIADTAILFTDFTSTFSDTVTWRLKWRLNFSPSDNNNSRVYLMSSDSNFNLAQGYYVRWGENGSSDVLKLYRFNGITNTLLITGTTVYGTASEITLNVVRWPNGNWVLQSDSNAGENFFVEGSTIDNTYATSQYFGLWCKFTTTNVANFFFDDVQVDSLLTDSEVPSLLEVKVISNNELNLVFSEPIDSVSANSISNYEVNNGAGAPAIATLANNDSVVSLAFSNSFTTGITYEITINGVEDLAGNEITGVSEHFVYLNYGIPTFRDVVINELVVDPTPVLGLPEQEFIELYNTTNQFFELNGAQILDASSTATVPNSPIHFIAPNEYVIICDIQDTALFTPFGKVVGVPSLPALNNAGDDVVLRMSDTLIDKLTYTIAWYQDPVKDDGGYSLELINPLTDCSGSNNWIGSNDASGGTPGIENSVFDTSPDTISPNLESVEVIAVNQLDLTFSEPIDSASLMLATINIKGGLTIDSIAIEAKFSSTATVYVSPEIDSSLIYSFSIQGATDCEGNLLLQNELQIGIGVLPKPFDIVFNEVYAAPDEGTALPESEYVEIYNRSNKLIRLAGLKLADASTASTVKTMLLFPQSYAIICDDGNASLFDNSILIATVASMPSLNNAGDNLSLLLNEETIDQLSYSDEWYSEIDPCCASLERLNPNDLCSAGSNWRPSTNELGGTPGYVNSVFSNAQTPFQIVSASISGFNEVIVAFSGRIDTSDLNSALLYVGTRKLSVLSVNSSGTEVRFSVGTPFERGEFYELNTGGLFDCAGNLVPSFNEDLYLHEKGAVILNEVLFNPTSTGSDFVEIKNTSAFDISLAGWSFGYYNTDDSLIYLPFEQSDPKILTGQHIAFTESPAKVSADYPSAQVENLVLTDLPSLPNEAGSVLIFDQMNELMDRFDYHEDYHFALLKDVDGVSLERISSAQPTNEPSNWLSASSAHNYATPGYENSQRNESFSASTIVSLNSEFVSPDNDGYQDVVGIEYKLNEPGYSISITVFNDQGFEIKSVVSNVLIGSEGIVNWDGTNNNGEKAQIGIHIVLVQLFNLEGGLQTFKLPVVVSGKL